MNETIKNVRVRLPQEVIDFIKENGNVYSGHLTCINLPQWFIETDNPNVYEVVFGKELIGDVRTYKNNCIKEQDGGVIMDVDRYLKGE